MATQQQMLDFYSYPSLLTSAGRYAPLFETLPNSLNDTNRFVHRARQRLE